MAPFPRVTVAIPLVDRLHLFQAHALRSALSQDGVEVDVIVVCDGSPDHVVEEVRAIADPRVRVIRHRASLGVAAARNAAIAAAQGEWIAILDDDDLWAPTKLARQVQAAAAAGAGFAYTSAVIVDETYRVRSVTSAPLPGSLLDALLRRNVMPGGGSNLLFSRATADAVGGFDGDLKYTSDWDMAIRLAAHAPGAAVNETLVAWFRHSRATAPSLRNAYADLAHLRRKHATLLREREASIDVAETLNWVGNSELDAGGRGYRLRAVRAFGAMSWAERRPIGLLHAARAILGRDVNGWLRQRVRARPIAPAWLACFSVGAPQPVRVGPVEGE
jgi:glycosyltransferase involved in cell wall biosynthesis